MVKEFMKRRGKILCLILSAALLLGMLPALPALAEENQAVLDVSQGRINVYADGYVIGNGAKIDYTGNYILTGSGNREVYFRSPAEGGADAYNVTVRNLNMNSATSCSALNISSGVTLNLTIEGDNSITADNHPGIQLYDGGNGVVNITLTDDSRLILDSRESAVRSANINITLNVTNASGISGLSNLDNRSRQLKLGAGELHECECSDYTPSETLHTGICDICGETLENAHVYTYKRQDEQEHLKSCAICGYEKAFKHEMVWEPEGLEGHYGYCRFCNEYIDLAEHVWGEGTNIPGTDINVPAVKYVCTLCGLVRLDEDGAGAIELLLRDNYGDGWNGAKLRVYRDGVLIRELEMDYGYDDEQTLFLPYSEEAGYAFIWIKGEYDEECGVTITLPGGEEPIYNRDDFDSLASGEILLKLNLADYALVEQALDEVPDNLEEYTFESAVALYETVNSVNWYMGKSQQEAVDGYAAAIKAALAALEPGDGTASGFIDIRNGDLYITSTGYRRGSQEDEIAYTGSYYLIGDTSQYKVLIESGSHEIIINGLNILRNEEDASPFAVSSGAEVKMSFIGDNRLIADYSFAGLNVPEGAKLNLIESSTGSLYVLGGDDAAGIGGNEDENAGVIIIDGGDITALSEGDGAGIGGGYRGGAGEIVINGGNIYAECLDNDGAGIGGGDRGQGGVITINGGVITALSLDDAGAGIGAGSDGYEDDYGYVDRIVINGGVITAGSDSGAAIGGGQDYGPCGEIIINGGIIIISSKHMNETLIGSPDYYEEREDNKVVINGGNIISDNYPLSEGVSPAPKNKNGQAVFVHEFIIDEEAADEIVIITLPDGSSRKERAYGVRVETFLPVASEAHDDISLSYESADYEAVKEALKKVPEDTSIYTEESVKALEQAIQNIDWDLDVRGQARVDEMARALEAAIANLEKIDHSGSTGDNGALLILILLSALGGAIVIAAASIKRKNSI